MDRTAVALVIGVLFAVAGTAGPAWADEDPIGFKKGLEDESDRAPNRTPAAEAYLIRAYPEPTSLTMFPSRPASTGPQLTPARIQRAHGN
jgi:hypothetical protein